MRSFAATAEGSIDAMRPFSANRVGDENSQRRAAILMEMGQGE